MVGILALLPKFPSKLWPFNENFFIIEIAFDLKELFG